jgi:hypothetical protein
MFEQLNERGNIKQCLAQIKQDKGDRPQKGRRFSIETAEFINLKDAFPGDQPEDPKQTEDPDVNEHGLLRSQQDEDHYLSIVTSQKEKDKKYRLKKKD